MKAATTVGVVLVVVGLIAAAGVYAPSAFGHVVRATQAGQASGDQAVLQVWGWGGARLGVSVRDVERSDVEREKLAAPSGAVVDEVRSGSPAEKAGLKAGDVLIEYDGERVRGARQLSRVVQETPVGRTVKAAVVRAGKRVDVELTPGSAGGAFGDRLGADVERLSRDLQMRIRPELDRLRNLRVEPFGFDFGGRLQAGRAGIQVQGLTPQLAEFFGVTQGALVTSVTPDSPAAKAGLKAGDVITALDGSPVETVSDLRRRADGLEAGAAFTIAIMRDKKAMTLSAKLDDTRPRVRRGIVSMQ